MWWLAIPTAVYLTKKLFDATFERKSDDHGNGSSSKPHNESILEKNLARLEIELQEFKSFRRIAVVGQPGAGKSSLIKKISNNQVIPSPVIGIQTDATDWSKSPNVPLISRWKNIILVDVPGYDSSTHPIKEISNRFPYLSFDLFILVIHGKIHSSDEVFHSNLRRFGRKCVVVRSFAEDLNSSEINGITSDLERRFKNYESIIFISNRTGLGIENLSSFIDFPSHGF